MPLVRRRADKHRRSFEWFVESKGHAAMSFLDFVHGRSEDQPSAMDDCYLVGDALDLVKQVRRKQDGPAFIGNCADNGAENIPANDRVETRGWFIKQQQFWP